MILQSLLSLVWASAALTASFHGRRQLAINETSHVGYSFGVAGVNASFDYVIVGGGTAGLAIATRLAENSSVTVAVVEAGGFYEADVGNISTTPGYDAFFAGTDINDTNPLIDWGFVTEPQAGANNRRLHYARGRTLGGSSARNLMVYHRPSIGSMQKWADDVGDSSYTFANLLPFYKKSVQYTPPSIVYQNSSNVQADGAFDASGGPLQVSFGKFEDVLGTWIQVALEAAGLVALKGFNLGELIGSAYIAFTENPINGYRSSSESSFLQSAQSPTNLFVYNNTMAHKIIFSGPQNAAQGVIVSPASAMNNDTTYTLTARREVILSAGAFQSPQLLMVSGVGPRSTLEQSNIPVLHDLPGVGQNLHDHPFFGISFRVDIATASAGLNNPALQAIAAEAFINSASGPLTNAAVPVIGFETLPPSNQTAWLSNTTQRTLSTFPPDWPQVEFLPAGTVLNDAGNFLTGDPVDGNNYATISTALITFLSRGSISISSPNMNDPPLIDPGWLTDPADANLAVAAFKRARFIWTKLSNITIGEEYLPGPQVQTDAEILEFIRGVIGPVWHAAATCKMGRQNDTMAVIDTTMRVYGTQRLRVVDASSFPFLPPGHPQSTVYALAEKAASDIKAGWS